MNWLNIMRAAAVILATLGTISLAMDLFGGRRPSQEWGRCTGQELASRNLKRDACDAIIAKGGQPPNILGVAYCNRSIVHQENGDIDNAIADADEAVRLGNPLCRGHGFRYRGDIERAIAAYSEMIDSGVRTWTTFGSRAAAYGTKGDYDRAIADYDKAILLKPDDVTSIYGRGIVHAAKNQLDLALADYDEAIRIWPTYSFALASRGRVYALRKEYDPAIADLDKAIQFDAHALAFLYRGNAYSGKLDYVHAIADYDEAIRLNPKLTSALLGRAAVRLYQSEYDQAIADYELVLNIDSQIGNAWTGISRARELKGSAAARAKFFIDKAAR